MLQPGSGPLFSLIRQMEKGFLSVFGWRCPRRRIATVEFETVSWEYWDQGWNECHPGMARRLEQLLREHLRFGYYPECEWRHPDNVDVEYLLDLEEMTPKRFKGPCRSLRRIVITHGCDWSGMPVTKLAPHQSAQGDWPGRARRRGLPGGARGAGRDCTMRLVRAWGRAIRWAIRWAQTMM